MNMYRRPNEPNETISNRDEIGKSKEKKSGCDISVASAFLSEIWIWGWPYKKQQPRIAQGYPTTVSS